MMTVDLTRANGTRMPYQLALCPATSFPQMVEARVLDAQRNFEVARARFALQDLPIHRDWEDAQSGDMVFGYEEFSDRVMLQFGEDERLAFMSIEALRQAMEACASAPQLVLL